MSGGAAAEVRIYGDPEEAGRAAAETVLSASKDAVAARGKFLLGLSGGRTPVVLYRLLGSEPFRSVISWDRAHVFWADERCVPADHEDSNYRLANDTFLSNVTVSPDHVHRIRGEEGPDAAARSYDAELRAFFHGEEPAFDLVLLGVGEDGHTASLFPGTAEGTAAGLFAVPVVRPYGLPRVSLTLEVLNSARRVVFLATGAEKAHIIAAILKGTDAAAYPAGRVRTASGPLWLLDRAAAAAL